MRISQADGRPPCINGDIAIQWEWSNFDHSQNQNSLTDYDKTLQNWLRPRDEHSSCNYSYSGEWCSSAFYQPTAYFLYTCISKKVMQTDTKSWKRGKNYYLWINNLAAAAVLDMFWSFLNEFSDVNAMYDAFIGKYQYLYKKAFPIRTKNSRHCC